MEANPSASMGTPVRLLVGERAKKMPPAIVAAVVQATALGAALMVLLHPELAGSDWSPIQFAFLQGGIALGMSVVTRSAPWWHFIHLSFVPAVVSALAIAIAPIWFLFAFAVMVLIYWSTFRTQVPLYLSSIKASRAIEDLLPDHSKFTFVDLGSGLGGLLAHLSKARKDGVYYGIESAPGPFALSWLRARFASNCQVLWGDFWAHDLSKYDMVYAYLSPVPMVDLWRKACVEMRPGSLFISNTFTVPGVEPTSIVPLDDFNQSTLYIWRM